MIEATGDSTAPAASSTARKTNGRSNPWCGGSTTSRGHCTVFLAAGETMPAPFLHRPHPTTHRSETWPTPKAPRPRADDVLDDHGHHETEDDRRRTGARKTTARKTTAARPRRGEDGLAARPRSEPPEGRARTEDDIAACSAPFRSAPPGRARGSRSSPAKAQPRRSGPSTTSRPLRAARSRGSGGSGIAWTDRARSSSWPRCSRLSPPPPGPSWRRGAGRSNRTDYRRARRMRCNGRRAMKRLLGAIAAIVVGASAAVWVSAGRSVRAASAPALAPPSTGSDRSRHALRSSPPTRLLL